MAVDVSAKATVFNFKTPLLASGRSMDLLARSELMTTHIKVYAEGGENAMHAHTTEDHLFVILAGQATFHLERDDNTVVLNAHEGVMLPKGAQYWFNASGGENLVMLRVAASVGGSARDRIGPDGHVLPGDSIENGYSEPVPIPGRFFS